MIAYQPNEQNDLLLAKLWHDIRAAGDLDRLLMPRARTLSGFYGLFRLPTVLVFETDDSGIWLAMWFEPIMSGAFVGLWIAPRMRHTKAAVDRVLEAQEIALRSWPVLIAVTKQENLLDEFARFGYDKLCAIPALFGGESAWITALTKETLDGYRRSERLRSAVR